MILLRSCRASLAVTQPAIEAAHPYYRNASDGSFSDFKLTEVVPCGIEGKFASFWYGLPKKWGMSCDSAGERPVIGAGRIHLRAVRYR